MTKRRPAGAEQTANQPSLIAIDFFCGAGGTTRGLIDAGGYVVAGIDKDKRCEQTFTENNVNASIDYSSPRFLHRDIFPNSDDYPEGEQDLLLNEVEDLLSFYERRAPGTP